MRSIVGWCGARVFYLDILLSVWVAKRVQSIQRWTGWTCYRLSMWFAALGVVNQLLCVGDYWVPWLKPNFDGSSFSWMLLSVVALLGWGMWHQMALSAERQLQANPRFVPTAALFLAEAPRWMLATIITLRLICLLLQGLTIYPVILVGQPMLWLDWVTDWGFPGYMYCIQVRPLPPGQAKLKAWVRSLFTVHRLVPIRVEG